MRDGARRRDRLGEALGALDLALSSADLAALTEAIHRQVRRLARSRRKLDRGRWAAGLLLEEPGLQIRAAFLDHGKAVLAFALEERAHINVWRNKVEAMGLSIGPWLRAFKQATLRGAPDDTLIEVAWRDRPSDTAAFLPLAVSKWRS